MHATIRTRRTLALVALAVMAAGAPCLAQSATRARDLGIPFEGAPGRWNAITDVAGVEVGHATIVSGSGTLVRGEGPVRTGVTVVHPRGRRSAAPALAGWHTLNGNGEMTGLLWLEESGFLYGPVAITNTVDVGVVRDAIVEWGVPLGRGFDYTLPVVAETWDGTLSDLFGFHVGKQHAFEALDGARSGPVDEGNVGGGTGMICHGFKGGIGTASRVLSEDDGGYTVGVLVQCNYGSRDEFRVAGVPVGEEIQDLRVCRAPGVEPSREWVRNLDRCDDDGGRAAPPNEGDGSIIIVVGTDAPLLPHQLDRIAQRAALGVGRMGGQGGNSSGDIFLAFSTANEGAEASDGTAEITVLNNERIDPLFEATIQATEEAILNAMVAAETMTGADGARVYALPHDRLVEVLKTYNRYDGGA